MSELKNDSNAIVMSAIMMLRRYLDAMILAFSRVVLSADLSISTEHSNKTETIDP